MTKEKAKKTAIDENNRINRDVKIQSKRNKYKKKGNIYSGLLKADILWILIMLIFFAYNFIVKQMKIWILCMTTMSLLWLRRILYVLHHYTSMVYIYIMYFVRRWSLRKINVYAYIAPLCSSAFGICLYVLIIQ